MKPGSCVSGPVVPDSRAWPAAEASARLPVGFVAVAALTAGLCIWPGFAYAWVRTRNRPWAWCAIGYLVPAVALVMLRAGAPEHGATNDLITVASFVLGGIGAVHLASIRQAFAWRHAAKLSLDPPR